METTINIILSSVIIAHVYSANDKKSDSYIWYFISLFFFVLLILKVCVW